MGAAAAAAAAGPEKPRRRGFRVALAWVARPAGPRSEGSGVGERSASWYGRGRGRRDRRSSGTSAAASRRGCSPPVARVTLPSGASTKKEVKGLRPKRRALIRRVAGSAALSPVAATQNSWRVRGQKARFFRRLIIFDGGQTLGRLARPLFCPPSKSLDLGRAFRWQHQFCLRARVGAWVRPVLPKSSIGLNNPADTL